MAVHEEVAPAIGKRILEQAWQGPEWPVLVFKEAGLEGDPKRGQAQAVLQPGIGIFEKEAGALGQQGADQAVLSRAFGEVHLQRLQTRPRLRLGWSNRAFSSAIVAASGG